MISVGQQVGNYNVTAKLGEGGMGVVYLAEHPVIGRKVALKAIHPELSKNPEVISRFMTEAKSVNQIGNEHIVDISDFGNTAEGEFYFVMEFLQGEALSDRLRREHHLVPDRALAICEQVADALFAAHEQGIIHRDLKPENIYLIDKGGDPDFVKVLDFGLAKLTAGDEKVTHKTRTGSVMGTPYYMSPEQCEGKASLDHRSDIYSLGVILFEMLTGKVPFGGEGYGEIIVKHITQAPPSAQELNPALGPEHDALIMRALTKDRDERFADMAEMRDAVRNPQAFAVQDAVDSPLHGPTEASGVAHHPSSSSSGALSRPIPTTFGSTAVELDGVDDVPRSKKGMFLGLGAAILVAAAGIFLFTGGVGSDNAQEPTEPSRPAVAPPSQPETVTLMFRSTPAGAEVTRLDTLEILGTTPLDKSFPFGEQAVEFVFKLSGYGDKQMKVVPSISAQLSAALESLAADDAKADPGGNASLSPDTASPQIARAGDAPSKTPKTESKASKSKQIAGKNRTGAPKRAKRNPAKPARRVRKPTPTRPPPPGRPLDEDAVLEPQF